MTQEEWAHLDEALRVTLTHPKARKLFIFAYRVANPAAYTPEMDDVEMELGPLLGEWLSQ